MIGIPLAIAGSVFPAFFQCTAMRVMPLHDPVENTRIMAAATDFSFDERLGDLIGVLQAKGSWTGEGWSLTGGVPENVDFRAMLIPSETDIHRWALDWDTTAGSSGEVRSSGVADCRLIDPSAREEGR